MIKIDAKVDVRGIVKQLADIKDKQLPFAMSLAINHTAQKVKAAEQHEIRDVFDRPTPYIQNSVFIKPSNKTNLTAKVWLKDQAIKGVGADKILAAEITGGQRRLKRFEKALMSAGALPPGYYTVPGKGIDLDAYGNVPASLIVRLLSYFKAFPEAGYKANMTDKGREKLKKGSKKQQGMSFFVGSPKDGKLPLGIWQRGHLSDKFTGPVRPIRPILMFMPFTMYEPIFDFKFVAENTINKEFDGEFIKAWNQAKLTAKSKVERDIEKALTGSVSFKPSVFRK